MAHILAIQVVPGPRPGPLYLDQGLSRVDHLLAIARHGSQSRLTNLAYQTGSLCMWKKRLALGRSAQKWFNN